jgi:hypothetical protein
VIIPAPQTDNVHVWTFMYEGDARVRDESQSRSALRSVYKGSAGITVRIVINIDDVVEPENPPLAPDEAVYFCTK